VRFKPDATTVPSSHVTAVVSADKLDKLGTRGRLAKGSQEKVAAEVSGSPKKHSFSRSARKLALLSEKKSMIFLQSTF
jgi:hypothetical protein